MSPAEPLQPAERRRWQRVGEELLIACRGKGHSSDAIYFTRNLSGGGLMFETPEAIPPESRLDIELYAPVDCGKQTRLYMLVRAQVRWTDEISEAFSYEGSNRYQIGVAFDEVDPQDQACLDEYVKKRVTMETVPRIV